MLGPRRKVRRRLSSPAETSPSPGRPSSLGTASPAASRRPSNRPSNVPIYVLLASATGFVALNSVFFLQTIRIPARGDYAYSASRDYRTSFLREAMSHAELRANALSSQRRRAQQIQPPLYTERQLLELLTKELQDRWTQQRCWNHTIRNASGTATSPIFPSSGLFAALRAYQDRHHPSQKVQLKHNTTKEFNEEPSTACWSPKEGVPACDWSTYGLMVVAELHDTAAGVRRLVLNCLKWLLDPAATEIWILLSESSAPAVLELEKNREYASRLLSWHSQLDHPVRLVFAPSLWEAVSHVSSRTEELTVLWMDGDAPFQGNRMGTQSGFQRWKEEPSGIVTPRAWTWPMQSGVSFEPTRKSHKPPQTRCEGESFIPNDSGAIPLVPDLHGMMHHSSYLCYLTHPVLKDLRTAAHTWSMARSAISLWMTYATPVAFETYAVRLSSSTRTHAAIDHRILEAHSALNDGNRSSVESPSDVFAAFFGGLPFRRRRDTQTKCT